MILHPPLTLMLFTDDDFLEISSTSTLICGQKSIHGKSSVATPTETFNNVSADKKRTNIRSSKAGTDTDCRVGSEFALGKGDRPFLVTSKLRGLSPRANYTDRAAAAGRRRSANFCG